MDLKSSMLQDTDTVVGNELEGQLGVEFAGNTLSSSTIWRSTGVCEVETLPVPSSAALLCLCVSDTRTHSLSSTLTHSLCGSLAISAYVAVPSDFTLARRC